MANRSNSRSNVKRCKWNKDTVYALGVYRLICRVLGIWPPKCYDVGSNIRFVTAVISELALIYFLLGELVVGCTSIIDTADSVGVLATTSVALLKIVVIRLNRIKVDCIMEAAVNDWSVFHDDESRKIMHRHAFIGRNLSIFQLMSTYGSAMLLVVGSPPTLGQIVNQIPETGSNATVEALRNLPVGTGRSVADWSMPGYLFFYLFQWIQLVYVVTSSMGIDALFFGFAMHFCAQLEVLKSNISQFARDCHERNVRKDLADLIERHSCLIGIVNVIKDVFHPIILGQLIATISHTSVLGIEVLYGMRDGNNAIFVYAISGICALLFQIYTYSYAGDYLSSQIKSIRDAAYNCPWCNFSPSLRKDLIFVIARSNHSFHLTAGKMYRMNVESFTSLLKGLMSTFSVLKLTILD